MSSLVYVMNATAAPIKHLFSMRSNFVCVLKVSDADAIGISDAPLIVGSFSSHTYAFIHALFLFLQRLQKLYPPPLLDQRSLAQHRASRLTHFKVYSDVINGKEKPRN